MLVVIIMMQLLLRSASVTFNDTSPFLIPSNDAHTVLHFECYWFDYTTPNCQSERQLCAYFKPVSDNNYNDTADIFLVHPMIEGSSTHQVLFTAVTAIDTTTFHVH